MSTGALLNVQSGVSSSHADVASGQPFPPINFVYRHLHDALRGELDRLTEIVHSLEECSGPDDVTKNLHLLRERYHLLVQVNRYHSSVEDEVSSACYVQLDEARFA
jgi:hypothetical protein